MNTCFPEHRKVKKTRQPSAPHRAGTCHHRAAPRLPCGPRPQAPPSAPAWRAAPRKAARCGHHSLAPSCHCPDAGSGTRMPLPQPPRRLPVAGSAAQLKPQLPAGQPALTLPPAPMQQAPLQQRQAGQTAARARPPLLLLQSGRPEWRPPGAPAARASQSRASRASAFSFNTESSS